MCLLFLFDQKCNDHSFKGAMDMSEKQNEKVYDLSFFMPGQTIEAEEVKVAISKRFVDEEGNVVPFIFKAITTQPIDELEKENTTTKM